MREFSRMMMFGLLILFCLVGLLLIRLGAASYEEVRYLSESQFKQRTPIGYITNKIRTYDKTYPIEIREKEGQNILVLKEGHYETWIYCLDQKLYEAYVSEGSDLGLDVGFEIMDLEALDFRQLKEALEVTVKPQGKASYTLLFANETR